MKQQIVIIGGGTTFESYEEYIYFLKNRELDLERMRSPRDWKNNLAGELGGDYDIFVPWMPNAANAQYEEWKIFFKRVLDLLGENAIFIGHSLGGIFLAKFFSETFVSNKIKAAILVAPPFDSEGGEEKLASFSFASSLEKLAKQVGEIYLIFSEDDPCVPFLQLEKYRRELPQSKTMVFKDRGHFNQESFPEIVSLIKKIN